MTLASLLVGEARPASSRSPSRDNGKIWTFKQDGVVFSNRFAGARLSGVTRKGPNHYLLQIDPETSPINLSAYYAYLCVSKNRKRITIEHQYTGESVDGKRAAVHRYAPKISGDGRRWKTLRSKVAQDDQNARASFRLTVGRRTTWVSSAELLLSSDIRRSMRQLQKTCKRKGQHCKIQRLGSTPEGRPIDCVTLGNPKARRHVVLLGRQHPPEVKGTLGLNAFIKRLTGNDRLARAFRAQFKIHVFPNLNPDGVDAGNWRCNSNQVDLNRAWSLDKESSQPEVKMACKYLRRVAKGGEVWLGLDFHSMSKNFGNLKDVGVFTPSESYPTFPKDLVFQLVDRTNSTITDKSPSLPQLSIQRFAPGRPESDSYIYLKLGRGKRHPPVATVEYYDELPTRQVRSLSRSLAEQAMRQLVSVARESNAAGNR